MARNDRKEKDIPTGRFSRLMRMSRLSGTVSTSYLGQKIRGAFMDEEARGRELLRTHLKNATRMAETMGNMKGAVMKVGQMISLGDDELLPPEAAEVLKVLQAQAPYLPFPQIRARLEQELEGDIDQLFAEFQSEPMAAASLGQVHRAVLHDGMEVAVKVQYPDIDKTIHSDLANLKGMLKASGVFGQSLDLDPYFDELEEMLIQELDYVQEAVNLEDMRRIFDAHPDIDVPRYVPDRSTERVLTMEMVHGKTLDKLLAGDPTEEVVDRAGWAIVNLILEGFLLHGVLHADPQTGNFLFHDDGRLVLLDYGCIKRFDPSFVHDFALMMQAQQKHDRVAVIDAGQALGYVKRDAGPRTRKSFFDLADIYARPIARDQVYTFGSEHLAEIGKDVAMKQPAVFNLRVPKVAVYLHRTLVGAYFVLASMSAKGNYSRRLTEILESMMAPGYTRPFG